MENKSILISGAGIGGPTLAHWLKRAGFSPTLVETSPELRTGGYVVDFWGLGYDIAARMGLLSDINRVGYHMRELKVVDGAGRRAAGFGTKVFHELTGGRFVTLGRSDLSRLIFDRMKDTSEIIFGNEIVALEEHSGGVDVQFQHGGARRFDLVIGADGLHSGVRKLVFGPQDQFEKSLGYGVAAFEVQGYRPRDEQVYVTYGLPGRQLARFAMHEDRTLFLFVFSNDYGAPDNATDLKSHDLRSQKALLRAAFAEGEWECARILDALDATEDLYFDRVSQIQMETWSRGRVALVGDAAFCVSLLAGQGTALAMTAAYVLAGELSRSGGRHVAAFQAYENLLRPFIAKKQKAAEGFARSFAPKTRLGLFFRNQVMKAFQIPGLARLSIGREIVDTLQLPDYGFGRVGAARD